MSAGFTDGEDVHIVIFSVKAFQEGFQLRLGGHLVGRLIGVGEYRGHQLHLGMPSLCHILFGLFDKFIHLTVVVGVIPFCLGGVGLFLHNHLFHVAGVALLLGHVDTLVDGVVAGALGIVAVVAGNAGEVVIGIAVGGFGEVGLDLVSGLPLVILVEDHSHIGLGLYNQTLEAALVQQHPGAVNVLDTAVCREAEIRISGGGDQGLIGGDLPGKAAIDRTGDRLGSQAAAGSEAQSAGALDGVGGDRACQGQGFPLRNVHSHRAHFQNGGGKGAGDQVQGIAAGDALNHRAVAQYIKCGSAGNGTGGLADIADIRTIPQVDDHVAIHLAVCMGVIGGHTGDFRIFNVHSHIAENLTVIAGCHIAKLAAFQIQGDIAGHIIAVDGVQRTPGTGLDGKGGASGLVGIPAAGGQAEVVVATGNIGNALTQGQVVTFCAHICGAALLGQGEGDVLKGGIAANLQVGGGHEALLTGGGGNGHRVVTGGEYLGGGVGHIAQKNDLTPGGQLAVGSLQGLDGSAFCARCGICALCRV